MKCEKCGKEHDGSFGSGRFCSRSCSCTRRHSDETKQKLKIKLKQWKENNPEKYMSNLRKAADACRKTKARRAELYHAQSIERLSKIPFEHLTDAMIRKKLYIKFNGKCANCGISTWCGKPLPLEVEHIDGNHSNNSENNLTLLCPNCHSQTSTYRGRNKNKKPMEIPIDEAKELLKTNSINSVLKKYKLSPSKYWYGFMMKLVQQPGVEPESTD